MPLSVRLKASDSVAKSHGPIIEEAYQGTRSRQISRPDDACLVKTGFTGKVRALAGSRRVVAARFAVSVCYFDFWIPTVPVLSKRSLETVVFVIAKNSGILLVPRYRANQARRAVIGGDPDPQGPGPEHGRQAERDPQAPQHQRAAADGRGHRHVSRRRVSDAGETLSNETCTCVGESRGKWDKEICIHA